MNYVNDIRELIGNTPIIKLNNVHPNKNVNIYAKLEYLNPGGSIKDRIGVSMIEGAERRGELKKGNTIIDATAGNTGIGIALAAINKGYKVIFVIPEKFSVEKQTLVKVLGAEVINTPSEDGMVGAFEKTKLLANKEGIIVGSSSGAALVAALKIADEITSGNIVTIFPDSGDRYLSEGLFD